MNLRLTITLSNQLFELLENKLPNLGRRVQRAVDKEFKATARELSKVTITVDPVEDTPQPEAVAPVMVTEDAPQSEASQPASENPAKPAKPAVDTVPAAVAEAQAAAEKKERKLSEEVRDIIHRTRQRFEGEDYLENAGSEHYKAYHRQLTARFKQIATLLGYNEKPTTIDTPEKVAEFAAQCDELYIGEDGKIAAKTPF